MPVFSFLLWLLLTSSAAWLAFPFSRRLFERVLPDSGWAIGRVLWLGAWTLGAFWLGHLGLSTKHGALLWFPLSIASAWMWWRDRESLGASIRARKRAIWTSELLFLGVFLLFFGLRGFWSDTNGTNGEKSMDSALIASLSRADRLPPPNPYAAGARLTSYYQFGHLQSALLTRASNSTTRWSYNWMCATLPALCVSSLWSLGAALTRSKRGGLWVASAVLGLGTLQPLYQWTHPNPQAPPQPFGLDFFATSRVLPFSINEYPWFTFNQADLHAHYFDLPLQIASMTLAWALFRRRSRIVAFVAALVLGAQILTNTWDFPIYFGIVALSIAFAKRETGLRVSSTKEGVAKLSEPEAKASATQSEGHLRGLHQPAKAGFAPRSRGFNLRLRKFCDSFFRRRSPQRSSTFAWRFALIFLVAVVAIAVALPFLLGLKSAANGPRLLPQPASPLREWLLLWGPIAAAWLGTWALLWRRPRASWVREATLVAGVLVIAFSTSGAWGAPSRAILPILLVLLAGTIWALIQTRGATRFCCVLAVGGLLALLWSETTWAGFLGDPNNPGFDDSKRQDTVFKFGMQTWMLWGTAASVGLWRTWRRWPLALKIVWVPVGIVMLISSMAVMIGRTRNFGFDESYRLMRFDKWDGWAHLAPPEQAAASWLERNTRVDETILEAEKADGGDYSEFTRFAHATGIPTVIGPQAHSFQWSPAGSGRAEDEWNEVFKRKRDAREIFAGSNRDARLELLRLYSVRFIVWGELERAEYPGADLESLAPEVRPVAQFGDAHRVTIYEVSAGKRGS